METDKADDWEITLWAGMSLGLISVGVGCGLFIAAVFGSRFRPWPLEAMWYPVWFGFMAAVGFTALAIDRRKERESRIENKRDARERKQKRRPTEADRL